MRNLARILTLTACFAASYAVDAAAVSDFEATIRVSGNGTYDYCVIGMKQGATDLFDNAYDIICPGLSMNAVSISCALTHPEWTTLKTEFRGDIRSPKETDEWHAVVNSNLPAGTALTMEIVPMPKDLPDSVMIMVDDFATGQRVDLRDGPYQFTSAGTGTAQHLKLVASQLERVVETHRKKHDREDKKHTRKEGRRDNRRD